ncbi:MAG: hypothetical protein H6760_03670 [Candidatus Nomurabacteria bacterium]|nr:MAG: hypothetical protein H6760_03670 [Candidatus Nomurabacteria bacterium]
MVLASLALAGAYFAYLRAIFKGEVPHPVTIGMWFVWVMLNFLTYREFTSLYARIFTYVQVACISLIMLFTLAYIVKLGWKQVSQIARIDAWDMSMGIGVVIALGYATLAHNPKAENIIAQVVVIPSFVPIAKMSFSRTQRMSQWPWSLGVLAYALQGVVAWPDGFAALVYPGVSLVCHVVVWFGAYRTRNLGGKDAISFSGSGC